MTLIQLSAMYAFISVCYARECDPETYRLSSKLCGIKEDGVYKYLGIPYAEPPVQRLRFAKPQQKQMRDGNYTEFGNYCPQPVDQSLSNNVSEDCLTLNIFRPASNATGLPVMVWIHGGSYLFGQSGIYGAAPLVKTGGLIVVTLNYRLGMFGFLYNNETGYNGNYGIWDQIEALKWINTSIAAFGGDKDQITLFGESAGGYSVGLLSLLPRARGLFQRVILQSGVALCNRTLAANGREFSRRVIELLKCNLPSERLLRACLLSRTMHEVINATSKAFAKQSPITLIRSIGPVIDGDLIPETPRLLIKRKDVLNHFLSLDYMAGVTNLDGWTFLQSALSATNVSVIDGISFDSIRPLVHSLALEYFPVNKEHALIALEKFYFKDSTNKKQVLLQASNLYTDLLFQAATLEELNIRGKNNAKSFLYLFSHPVAWGNLPNWIKGATHASELQFLWQFPRNSTQTNKISDQKMITEMRVSWAKFAREGRPAWNPYERPDYEYGELNDGVRAGRNFEESRRMFWLSGLTELNGDNSSASYTHISMDTGLIMVLLLIYPFVN